jgi:hypothetical protein
MEFKDIGFEGGNLIELAQYVAVMGYYDGIANSKGFLDRRNSCQLLKKVLLHEFLS